MSIFKDLRSSTTLRNGAAALRPVGTAALGLLLLTALTGCGTIESVQGDTIRYTRDFSWFFLILALSGGIGGFGVFVLAQGGEAWRGWVIIGLAAFIFFGMAPSPFFAHVTLHADRAEFADNTIWFFGSTQTVNYSEARSIETITEEKWSRRGKRTTDYLVISLANGGVEKIQKTVLVKAAEAKFHERWRQFNQPAGQPGGAPAGSAAGLGDLFSGIFHGGAQNPAQPGGTNPAAGGAAAPAGSSPTNPFGNAPAGAAPRAPGAGRPDSAGRPIDATTPLAPGMRIDVLWGSLWFDATVVELLPDGHVKVHYEGWDSQWDEAVDRSKIRIPQ